MWDFSWQICVACLAEVFIASTLREIFYVCKSITYIAQFIHARLIHVRTPFDVVLILTRNECYSIRFSTHISKIAKRPFELSLDQTRNLRCSLRRSAYLEVFICSWCRTFARIVWRNEIACAMQRRDRVSVRAVENAPRNNVWSSMRYQEAKHSRKLRSRFDPDKLIRPKISHSAVLTTHLLVEYACVYALNCSEIVHIQRVGSRQ